MCQPEHEYMMWDISNASKMHLYMFLLFWLFQISVYAPREQISQAEFALDAAVIITEYYEHFFGSPFPLPKQGRPIPLWKNITKIYII